MITEDYISFETAKLLKEKGFDEKCRAYYKAFPESRIAAIYHSSENRGVSEDDPNEILCPTLQMAMKWLREVHRRIISPKYNEVKDERGLLYSMWFFDILPISKTLPIIEYNQSYDTYEEACESAIKYCLENLI